MPISGHVTIAYLTPLACLAFFFFFFVVVLFGVTSWNRRKGFEPLHGNCPLGSRRQGRASECPRYTDPAFLSLLAANLARDCFSKIILWCIECSCINGIKVCAVPDNYSLSRIILTHCTVAPRDCEELCQPSRRVMCFVNDSYATLVIALYSRVYYTLGI